ncbi:DUF2129 domain-containing protein [Fictibacillus sp. WQ 8-8]|uniref:YlbG family protein n=1 Tax=unclassified Fictibacillus TaxID=2644029 RepID=UPI0006A7E57E|nr:MULTISPECIES: DUF2129 domain-containing protein [unclassified Fictibacillus]MCQ6265672.1 DUF2129 domain-containing protein [Fictibacillus sp. WQ 8-8]MED2973446.1 DUF2129 domain-containing protein [Fictibacillus sp. B-59209]UZJ77278.1 DUF2129 domain-containing protein [Fictibacillus sp. KU28468]SFE11345.1 Uncharacterized protein YlbG, UPF0298 family [Bacillus sp. OV194]
MIGNRMGLAVYLHSLKFSKQLRRYGNVHYISKRLKYAVIYCDAAKIDDVAGKLESLHFVKEVKRSHKHEIKTEYESKIPDKAKEYDYKMGL